MTFRNPIITDYLIDQVVESVPARRHGIHGLPHWVRVERNGLYLAACTSADPSIISLFALFHDSRRRNDDIDPGHGSRGARLAEELFQSGLLPIDEPQMQLLAHACTYHTDEHFSDNLTIQCCWDADRLDMPRIGIKTEPSLLNTLYAREIAEADDYSRLENARFEFSSTV